MTVIYKAEDCLGASGLPVDYNLTGKYCSISAALEMV